MEPDVYKRQAFGDPFLLKASDGKFYMYGTGGVQNGFKVYSSDDLVTWKDEGPVYHMWSRRSNTMNR